MDTLNSIRFVNQSGLDADDFAVWIAGFVQDASAKNSFYILAADGCFANPVAATDAPFRDATKGICIQVPDVANGGSNRLVVAVTKAGSAPPSYPLIGYTAYPFSAPPGAKAPGPYDIFEFGPDAQYDLSAADSFGLNLSFTIAGSSLSYGASPGVTRKQVGDAFKCFTKNDPNGTAFLQLLYTSPTGPQYPELIEGQFSAIVAPKDWLAINREAPGLSGYWTTTVDSFFKSGNQLSFYLNGATVGTYSGSSNGTCFTLSGPDGLTIEIPKADFAGEKPFFQAVRKRSGESARAYAAFGQIEAAIFEAFSRGVLLDGVAKAGTTPSATYSSDAWIDTGNWFTDHPNKYDGTPSVYDVYAKFLHYSSPKGTVDGNTIFGKNSAGAYGMAYGFSIDENPNVGSEAWPASLNTPSKTPGDVGAGQAVTLTLGPWSNGVGSAVFQVSMVSQNDPPNHSCPGCSVGAQLRGKITKLEGVTLLSNPPASYPRNALALNKWVDLPVPGQPPSPTPTWFLLVEGEVGEVVIHAEIETPAHDDVPVETAKLVIQGADMKSWVEASQKQETNQVYQTGCCGIFGYAQHHVPSGQPEFWIYTLTGGVCIPQAHPR